MLHVSSGRKITMGSGNFASGYSAMRSPMSRSSKPSEEVAKKEAQEGRNAAWRKFNESRIRS
jgi:hypothetical protein